MSTKALKKELLAAVVLLLVAAVALSGSTYAWFATNNKVTAQTITATAQTADMLLISKDNTTSDVYKTSIELELTTTSFTAVSAGADLVKTGEFYKVKETGWVDETGTASSISKLAYDYEPAVKNEDFAVADIWLTDSNKSDIYFTKDTSVLAKKTVKALTDGEWYDVYAQFVASGSAISTVVLTSGAAVTYDEASGVVNSTPAAVSTSDAAIAAALDSLQNALGAMRLTFVKHDVTIKNTGTNNASNTAATGAAVFYALSNSTEGYYNTQEGNTTGQNVSADKRIQSVTTGAAVLEADSTSTLNTATSFTTLAGADETQHFKVYCYLEGCDKQCVSGIADGTTYIVKLGFATQAGK